MWRDFFFLLTSLLNNWVFGKKEDENESSHWKFSVTMNYPWIDSSRTEQAIGIVHIATTIEIENIFRWWQIEVIATKGRIEGQLGTFVKQWEYRTRQQMWSMLKKRIMCRSVEKEIERGSWSTWFLSASLYHRCRCARRTGSVADESTKTAGSCVESCSTAEPQLWCRSIFFLLLVRQEEHSQTIETSKDWLEEATFYLENICLRTNLYFNPTKPRINWTIPNGIQIKLEEICRLTNTIYSDQVFDHIRKRMMIQPLKNRKENIQQ